jgi:hypothetical protein
VLAFENKSRMLCSVKSALSETAAMHVFVALTLELWFSSRCFLQQSAL